MRGRGRAAAIAHHKEAMPVTIGFFEDSQYPLQVGKRDGAHHLLKFGKVRKNRFQFPSPPSGIYSSSVCSAYGATSKLLKLATFNKTVAPEKSKWKFIRFNPRSSSASVTAFCFSSWQ